MAAEQQPNFFFRGVRKFAELTFPPAVGLAALALLVSKFSILAGPALGLAIGDAVALGTIKKSRAIA